MANIFDLFRKIESESASASGKGASAVSHIVVGLGNPGKQYEGTRHNVGFDALLAVSEGVGARPNLSRFHALVSDGMIGAHRVLFMMPETFMNLSGVAVSEAANFYKIPPENILVLCDDISFEVGRMRLRQKGSAGGHNGLKSIIEKLGSDAFARLKIGVGQKPHPDYDLADWVLGRFSDADREILRARADAIRACVEKYLDGDFDAAVRALNAPPAKGEGGGK